MSAVAETSIDAAAGDRLARRNATILAVAQALAGGNNVVLIATGAIVGAMLAPDRSLATVPVSIYVVGMWMGALPRGWIARHYGRQASFFVGTGFGVLAGLFNCAAVVTASFTLLCIGALCTGFYAAVHQSYRFAAADTASDKFRPKAISWVMVGGIFAGLFGSQLVIFTKDLWQPYLFAGSFIAQAAVALVSAAVLVMVKIPMLPAHIAANPGRPISEIARQPRFIAAVACGVGSYSMMNMVMTSAPLAMVDCNHSISDAALGIQWHILGMFVPSLFTGSLILRFGVERIVGAGLALIMVSAVVSISGISLWHFWIGLTLLGLGWNFAFVGATTMVTQCHRPEERNKVQSFNDFLVFGSMAIGSFSSGALLVNFGWAMVNNLVFPVILAAAALLIWQATRPRAQAA
ncbi:MAG TPA: MFS transporter [Xanthobacteraceae bacterium]|nr:MFS transporter [Xanthobacteraceae bacterium]